MTVIHSRPSRPRKPKNTQKKPKKYPKKPGPHFMHCFYTEFWIIISFNNRVVSKHPKDGLSLSLFISSVKSYIIVG